MSKCDEAELRIIQFQTAWINKERAAALKAGDSSKAKAAVALRAAQADLDTAEQALEALLQTFPEEPLKSSCPKLNWKRIKDTQEALLQEAREIAQKATKAAALPDLTTFTKIVAGSIIKDIRGTQHKDYMVAHGDGSTLRGMKGRDYLEGKDGKDFLSGGNARDWLIGGRNADRLQGGKQDDILTGGTGKDTFVFRTEHGKDTITDFSPATDIPELHGVTFSDLTIKKWAKGTGARIEWDEGVIHLAGVQKDTLTADTFEFV
ncbi:MAG: hypothetical protein GDA53_08620 [Rhodobacteraceae bacterium]|nr:hypothetical protein [Paracoccaceae bacterium]